MSPAAPPEVASEPFESATSYVLREPSTGSEARVLPEVGCTVVGFRTTVGGVPLDVVQPPPSVEALREQPTWYAIPVLFPFPGRIANARFDFAGREVAIAPTDRGVHAIHGVVCRRPWRVLDAGAATERGAALRCQIDTADFPDVQPEWPFPFRLSMEVLLKGGVLGLTMAATNTGPTAMPMGIGLHPYFATPFGASGGRDDCLVSVDADQYWEQERAFPTGVVKPVAEAIDLRRPVALGALPSQEFPGIGKMQNLLHSKLGQTRGRPADAPGGIRAAIRDASQTLEVVTETSATFGALVLFTPPWNTSLSLEPHTCVPDAFNLANRGLDTGTIVLEPGETWRGWVRISARAL